MSTPVEVFLAVAGMGGRLGIAGDKLRMLLPSDCSPELKQAIRCHKVALIDLMRLTFLVVESGALNTTVFFVPDEAIKDSLVSAGAERSTVYSAAELRALAGRGVTAVDLPLIHAAKQQFDGKVSPLR